MASEKSTYNCIPDACYCICQLTNDGHCIWKFFVRGRLSSNITFTSTGFKDTKVGRLFYCRSCTFGFAVPTCQSLIHCFASYDALRTCGFRGRCDLICWAWQTGGEGIIQCCSLYIHTQWRYWFGTDWQSESSWNDRTWIIL